ncbi:hypothetical protein F5B19DRAFT_486993 [Rostrohypoxylon terebratum]|nr:hypothetical protein F5B19DRAFT_486993 [Rostrohypoxylon terebratum]
MTGTSPTLMATANLTPLSPAPLHPSSPVVVPALQDQADTLYTMSLSDGDRLSSTAAANQSNLRNDVVIAAGQLIPNGSPAAADYQHNHLDGTNGGTAAVPYLTYFGDDKDGDKEAGAMVEDGTSDTEQPSHDQHSGAAEAQQTVTKANASAFSRDLSGSQTGHSEVKTSTSYDLSSSTSSASIPIPAQHVHQSVPVPNTSRSSPQEIHEPHEPQEQEQAVVASPTAHTSDSLQPPAESATETEPQTQLNTPYSAANAIEDSIDIQDIVDKIIGNSATGPASQSSSPQIGATTSTLPPRPPMSQQPSLAQPHVHLENVPGLNYHANGVPSSLPPPPGTYSVGASGTALDTRNNLPPPPSSSSLSTLPAHPFPVAQFDPTYLAATGNQAQSSDQSQQWESFLSEERRYVSEAKWDRFPEGSRLFIGNLSSDRVSKKEVFDLFSKYGRLAQISLKQAYGFVQYHTLAEGQAAMDHLQGIDVRGRKIHLEFSRTQKKDGDNEKRGNKGKRDNERHDTTRARRDDYRPSRQPSPRRGNHRPQNSYDNGRGYYDDYGSRGRSRSPSYGRRDSGHYRRRSPSPYRRHSSEAELEIPRRYGGDVPDVQFLILQEVDRDFVGWVERSFLELGLKVQVMFLLPHMSREAVVQRQVMEGVCAVVELDFQAQRTGTVSLQVFNRSGGRDNVRYDQYQDLNPAIAAQLVQRTKQPADPVQPHPPYGGVQYPHAGSQYPHAPQPAYVAPAYPGQAYPNAPVPPPTGTAPGPLDNATLQKILGSIHSQQGTPPNAHQAYSPAQPVGRPPPHQHPNAAYAGVGATNTHMSGGGQQYNTHFQPAPAPGAQSGEQTQHVQTIMAQLARYRQ